MKLFKLLIGILLIAVACSTEESASPPEAGPRLTGGSQTMVLKGGGWETAADLAIFEGFVPAGDIAIILSATTAGATQGTQTFYDWYAGRSTRKLLPIYTYAGAATGTKYHADHDSNLETLRKAAGIIITGGDPLRLKHLVGSKLGAAVKSAYENGIPLYANSAGLSILAPHFTWSLSNRSRSAGLGLLPTPVLSHINDYNLFCDLWNLVPQYAKLGFGITKDTIVVIRNGELRVHPDRAGKVYRYETLPASGCVPPALAPNEGVSLR